MIEVDGTPSKFPVGVATRQNVFGPMGPPERQGLRPTAKFYKKKMINRPVLFVEAEGFD